MDLEFLRIEILIIAFSSLLLTLPWGIAYSVYLHRIGSHGMASVRRLTKKTIPVLLVSFIGVTLYRDMKIFRVVAGAGMGKAESQFDLASGYYRGETFLKQDYSKANYWYQRAAESGHAQAQYELALMNRYGEGTRPDDLKSMQWASRSAAQGNCYALVLMGELLATSPKAEDQARALDAFQRALPLLKQRASNLEVPACVALGRMYQAGNGVKLDPVEGLKWMIIGDRIGLSPIQHLAFEQLKKLATPSERAEAQKRASLLFPGLRSEH